MILLCELNDKKKNYVVKTMPFYDVATRSSVQVR